MSEAGRINGPTDSPVGSDQYQQDCIFALEPSVIKLIKLAAEAGWDEQQAVCAVMCVAALQVNDKTLFQIERMDSALANDAEPSGGIRFHDIASLGLSPPSDRRARPSQWNAPTDTDEEEPRDP